MTDLLYTPPSVDVGTPGYSEVLDAFKEVVRAATGAGTPGRLDQLLRLVGQRICELIKVRRCSVYLHAGGGVFHGRVGYCASDRIDDRIKPLISGIDGDRFTREIVERKAPVLVKDACRDDRTIQRTMRRWGVQDMLGVPLTFADEVIGIIYIDDLQNGHVYTDQEIHVAQTFANLAALAIREASLFSQLNQRALVIDKQRRMLHQVAEAHQRLTQAVLSGMGLNGVADLIVDILDRPLLALNEHLEVMIKRLPAGADPDTVAGWESSGRDSPLMRAVRGVAATSPSVILAPAPGSGCTFRQIVCPMVAEGRTVGYVVLLELGRPFSALDTRVAEHGATVLTLQLMIELHQMSTREQAREELLADILDAGRDRESVKRRGQVLGVDLDTLHVAVRVSNTVEAEGEPSKAGRRNRLGRRMAASLGVAEPLSATFPGAYVFLLPFASGPEMAALRRIKEAVSAALAEEEAEGGSVAVISPACRSADAYPAVHRELRQLLELLQVFPSSGGRVELAGELGVLRLLSANVAPPEALAFSRDLLRPLVGHDAEYGTELVSTMREFLRNGGRVRATAKDLSVHENTIRYRLARVRELSTLDPERIETLLDLRFAFQVLELSGEPVPGISSQPGPDPAL